MSDTSKTTEELRKELGDEKFDALGAEERFAAELASFHRLVISVVAAFHSGDFNDDAINDLELGAYALAEAAQKLDKPPAITEADARLIWRELGRDYEPNGAYAVDSADVGYEG